MLKLIMPFPQSRLAEAWEWHKGSKALTARLGKDGFLEHFSHLLVEGWSWALEVDGRLGGIFLLEPTLLPGDSYPTDAYIHIALARRAWGKEVIQQAAVEIVPAVFAAVPSLRRLSAWTAASNHPARAVAESLGFSLEGALRNALSGGETLLLYGLPRDAEAGVIHGIGS